MDTMPAQRRLSHWLALMATTAVLALQPLAATGQGLPPPRSPVAVAPLVVLSDHLATGHAADRIHFAAIALEELAQSYTAEVFAGDPDQGEPAGGASHRWRRAAHAYAGELMAMRGRLAQARDVAVLVDPGQQLRLVMGADSVILESPRLGDPHTLERRIFERYCRIAACPDLEAWFQARDDDYRRRLWATWSFGAGQPPLLETSAGLHFRFRDRTAMDGRKAACLALLAALEGAAGRLGWFRDHGVPVDWGRVHVARLPASGLAAVVINRDGDYLPLELAYRPLPRGPIAAWLRARVHGGTARHVFDQAEGLCRPAAQRVSVRR